MTQRRKERREEREVHMWEKASCFPQVKRFQRVYFSPNHKPNLLSGAHETVTQNWKETENELKNKTTCSKRITQPGLLSESHVFNPQSYIISLQMCFSAAVLCFDTMFLGRH